MCTILELEARFNRFVSMANEHLWLKEPLKLNAKRKTNENNNNNKYCNGTDFKIRTFNLVLKQNNGRSTTMGT